MIYQHICPLQQKIKNKYYTTILMLRYRIPGRTHQSYRASFLPYGPAPMWLLVVPCRGKSLKRTAILLWLRTHFFNHSLESQFCKTFEDKWPERMQKCILRKIDIKMEMLIAIANKIFQSLFSFENCDRLRRSRLFTTSHVSYAIHHRGLFPYSFESFWTTLHKHVLCRSIRWRYVMLSAQAQNL